MTAQAFPAVTKALSEFTDEELADLFGYAALKVEQRANAEALRDKYRGELQRRFELAPAAEEQFVEGLTWSVRLSPRHKETKIVSPLAVYRALKMNVQTFVDLVMGYVPLGFLEEELGKKRLAELVTADLTGYRTVKAVLKFPPAA